MRQFFESEIFKNVTSFMAFLVSIGALITSVFSLMSASDAKTIQEDAALHQRDYLQVYRGFVRVLVPNETDWKSFYRPDDVNKVEIPSDVWNSATARGITFRMNNEGQMPAHLRAFSLTIGDGRYFDDQEALVARCAANGPDSWANCPDEI